jgi:methionyl aminopeptidase
MAKITLKSPAEIELMRNAGALVAQTLDIVGRTITAGMTTSDIDKLVEDNILAASATPAFKGYHGFPASACVSIDEEVVHGIPGSRKLQEGDIVSVDVGVALDGWYGDSAATFAVGEISESKQKLMDTTREALFCGIEQVRSGVKLGAVSSAIQKYAESRGYSVVRDLVGHGIGRKMHEEPQVPNYGSPDQGPVLKTGMVIAIEPMINVGGREVITKKDGWTIVTADEKTSAHFEHTIAVTDEGADILSLLRAEKPERVS